MNELTLFTKLFSENSISAIFLGTFFFFLFKIKNVIYFYYEVKEIHKNQLKKKFTQDLDFYNLFEPSDTADKSNIKLFCEEKYFHAILGIEGCSRLLSKYILSRENVSRAIFLYKNCRDFIEYDRSSEKFIMKPDFKNWRVNLNLYAGFIFYFLTGMLASLPMLLLLLIGLNKNIDLLYKISFLQYILMLIYIMMLAYSAYVFLIEGAKPRFAKVFCNLSDNSPNNNV